MRIATAVALLAPLGLMMGMPFAIGMRAAARRDGAPTAFFWGINGALSICGSVFGLVIALFWGISTAFRVGSLSYLLAAVSMAAIARATVRRAPAGNGEHIPNEPSPVEDRYAEQLHDRHPTSVKAAGCAHMCAGFLPMTD
jgi:hypothetical protein